MGGKILSHKKGSAIIVWKCLPEGPSRSEKLAIRASGILLY